ncbi:Predicted dehydrogenase [Planifilum fulgidum]|jgi:predicted dehydrogenase|uniref:Predicted dehydrogenase n=1 Tax=Planifilum fulgidum TaxID=201973 RepID=A0A1I2MXT6_9BACL|nr:Gfo/Idh/MocA family oxidoreductase [Planifilum fulgidum]SFF93941.1 Predicted dehydrogenase [Planifilum fulgidum]
MRKKWRFGIVGAGGISELHLKTLEKEPRAEVAAISDVAVEKARERAEKHRIPHIYRDYRDLIRREDVDAVLVCVPNDLHAPVAIEALRAGKHVLCEKPMAINGDLARQMAEVARETDRVLMIGQNNRFHSEVLLLKELIEKGKLGQIYHAKTGWIRRNGIPGWGSWFTSMERAGGGPLIDIGVHMLDLTLWLMGFPKPLAVFGQTYGVFGPRKKGLSSYGSIDERGVFDVEDLAVAMIRFEGGVTLTLDVSWAAYVERDRVFVNLFGSEGGAAVDLQDRKIALFHEEGNTPVDSVIRPARRDDRLHLLKNFIDSMEGTASPICTPEHGVYIHRILDAIYRSSRTGELVKLD